MPDFLQSASSGFDARKEKLELDSINNVNADTKTMMIKLIPKKVCEAKTKMGEI